MTRIVLWRALNPVSMPVDSALALPGTTHGVRRIPTHPGALRTNGSIVKIRVMATGTRTGLERDVWQDIRTCFPWVCLNRDLGTPDLPEA